jgi:DNA-binding beta-propeller fold protein YncE
MDSDYGTRIGPATVLNGVILVLALQAPSLFARTLGMVADDATRSVTVFDADTDTVLGSVTTIPGFSIGDVVITPDQTRGFVTNFNSEVFVIDLTALPPRLAEGPNPIPISNHGEELAISPDGKFLLVCDSIDPQPISVVDIASQTEIHTLFVGSDTSSIEVCSDGSVLAVSYTDRRVRRLTIDGAGLLRDTGEGLSLGSDEPNNVFCAPGGTSGLVLNGFPAEIKSFTIPGLKQVDTRPLSGIQGVSGLVDFAGRRVFARSGFEGLVDVFAYNAVTAVLGAEHLFSIPVSSTFASIGWDQIALHPYKGKLYVSEYYANDVKVYDARTGVLLTSITDPHIVQPSGIAVASATDPCAGSPPAGAIEGTDGPDALRGTSGDDVISGLGGNDTIDGRGGDDLICGGEGNDRLRGGAGDDIVGGGGGNDAISGAGGNDTLRGDAGNDAILGGPGNDRIDGGAGRDLCTGNSKNSFQNCNP